MCDIFFSFLFLLFALRCLLPALSRTGFRFFSLSQVFRKFCTSHYPRANCRAIVLNGGWGLVRLRGGSGETSRSHCYTLNTLNKTYCYYCVHVVLVYVYNILNIDIQVSTLYAPQSNNIRSHTVHIFIVVKYLPNVEVLLQYTIYFESRA